MMMLGCKSGTQGGPFSDERGTQVEFEQLLTLMTDAGEKGDNTKRTKTDDRERVHDATGTSSDLDSSSTLDSAVPATFIEADSSADGQQLEFRLLSLNEALKLALDNSEFVVDSGSFLSPDNPVLSNPQFLQSSYDLEMQKSSREGVDAALADFDLQIASGVQWGRNSFIPNISNVIDSTIPVTDNGTFYGRMDKPLRSGGSLSVIHSLNYTSDTESILTYNPRYSGYLRGEFRQPIMAGRGRAFTEIAGPQSYRSRQLNHGLALAEIAEQTATIDFQMGLERLLNQTEEAYWDCWLAHQVFINQQTATRHALDIWTRIKNRADTGLTGGGAAEEAQAEENYYRRKSLADDARIEREQASERLSHLIGVDDDTATRLLAINNPIDVPNIFELESSIANALNNRHELKKQDLQIQAIEFQLYATRQLNKPQLDLVSGVQFNGLGDQLFDPSNSPFADILGTDDVGWNVGFEFTMPLGFNHERLNARYLNLLLAKAQSARQLQEKEIRYQISFAAKTVERWTQSLASAKQRLAAAERRLAAVEADFQSGRSSLDLFLRSQDSVAQAKVEMARALAQLNKAQLDLLYQQGKQPGLDLAHPSAPNTPSRSNPPGASANPVYEPYPPLD